MLSVNELIGFGVGGLPPFNMTSLYGSSDAVDRDSHSWASVPLNGMDTIIIQAGCSANGYRDVDFVSCTVEGYSATRRVITRDNGREYTAAAVIFTFDNSSHGFTSGTIAITTTGVPRSTTMSVVGVNRKVSVPDHSATNTVTPLQATINTYVDSFTVGNLYGYNSGVGVSWNVLTEYYENLAEGYCGSYARQQNSSNGSLSTNIGLHSSFGAAIALATWKYEK